MRMLRRSLTLLAPLALLAACAEGEPPAAQVTVRPYDYTYLTPLRLDVARVEIVEAYQPPRTAPNVDHLMVVAPKDALARMARDRVLPWGTEGVATVTVTEASMTEQKLERSSVASLFAAQPSERYTLTLGVVLDVQGGGALRGGGINGRAEARVMRSRAVDDGVTLAERERIWDAMLREAMDDARGMNVEFEFQVRQALRSLLVPENTPRPSPAEVQTQELAPPGGTLPAPGGSSAPRELTPSPPASSPPGSPPVAPAPSPGVQNPASPPPGLIPGPGGTPGMGTLGTMPVQR